MEADVVSQRVIGALLPIGEEQVLDRELAQVSADILELRRFLPSQGGCNGEELPSFARFSIALINAAGVPFGAAAALAVRQGVRTGVRYGRAHRVVVLLIALVDFFRSVH